jgi:Reverse transcriptase (RNA-dependent DNA polymerase)
LDQRFGNTKWQDAILTEMEMMKEYDVFINFGHKSAFIDKDKLNGYKLIRTHLIFDVKHDGRHRARMVADGHLTDVPLDSVYSGVVSLRGLRLMIFLAELNYLQTWATDIGSAYLEAETSEKVYIIAGPEFGNLIGHILVIKKALYGLRTSGVRWHERLSDCLREMGFQASWAEPDIWMRQNGEIYEYIAVYVDDLAIAAKDPMSIVNVLTNKYKFKLKGTGTIEFHLGMDFFRDDDGVLCIAPRKYIEKMKQSYEQMFGKPPSTTAQSPLEKNDHPELDDSELLDEEGIQKYQSLVGAMQWAVSIGRIDITTAVMTMSSFRASPRQGHLDRIKRIYGYLSKFNNAALRIRVNEPDFSSIPEPMWDWAYTVYGDGEEQLPHDPPTPLGNYVTLMHYVDANLYHDLLTGRAVTGILHFCNQTPIDWYSKKQSTVETATYGSEFVAARTCVEQILELRHTLRYLGVPICGKSYMFGDNESVVNSSMHPHAKLHKRHTMLSFHQVRQAIAHKILNFFHIEGKFNPADILSKHWSHNDIWHSLQPLMFYKGNTAKLIAQ